MDILLTLLLIGITVFGIPELLYRWQDRQVNQATERNINRLQRRFSAHE